MVVYMTAAPAAGKYEIRSDAASTNLRQIRTATTGSPTSSSSDSEPRRYKAFARWTAEEGISINSETLPSGVRNGIGCRVV